MADDLVLRGKFGSGDRRDGVFRSPPEHARFLASRVRIDQHVHMRTTLNIDDDLL